MNSMSSKIDMLQGSLPKNILLFTLPIALASIFQQLFNAMDTSIIGLFDNAYSLAAAILRALGDSKYPFIALILAGILNLILNFIFVAICHFSVAGVALATVISTAISAVMVLFRLRKYNFESNYSTQTASINILLELLIIGIPAAIQGAVFCFSNIFVQAAINVFGFLQCLECLTLFLFYMLHSRFHGL